MSAPSDQANRHKDEVLVGGQNAEYEHHQAGGGQDSAHYVEWAVGIRGHGVDDPAAKDSYDHDDQGLEHEGGAPTDRLSDQATDQRPHGRPYAAHTADDAEGPGARFHVAPKDGGEDIDRRDQQCRPDPFQDRVAEDQHSRARAPRR